MLFHFSDFVGEINKIVLKRETFSAFFLFVTMDFCIFVGY